MKRLLAGCAALLASVAVAEAADCANGDDAFRHLVWFEHQAMQQYLDHKLSEADFAQLFHVKVAVLDQEVTDADPATACHDIDVAAKDFKVNLGWAG